MEGMTFAEKLKHIRKVQHISQRKLCMVLEVPRRTLEDWERGLKEPPVYVQNLLLNYLTHGIIYK